MTRSYFSCCITNLLYKLSQWNKILGNIHPRIYFVIPIFDTLKLHSFLSFGCWFIQTRGSRQSKVFLHSYISMAVQEDCVGALWIHWQVLARIIMEFKYIHSSQLARAPWSGSLWLMLNFRGCHWHPPPPFFFLTTSPI